MIVRSDIGKDALDPVEGAACGLFDGFEGYRTPTENDYRRVLIDGLVVPDTNVLLNLYRYNGEAQADLLAVLDKLDDRLWVPHQVVMEFWRNRESALRDPQDTAENAVESLRGFCDQSQRSLRTWANRVALPDDRMEELQRLLGAAFEGVIDSIMELVDADAVQRARDTNSDPTLGRLEVLFKGRVGAEPSSQERAAAIKEGLRRVEAGIPPGFRDKAKGGDAAAGDYLVWEQVLREAARRRRDVLFVTGDVKEDWWRRVSGETRGPRLELVEELRSRAGTRLFLVQPKRLLQLAAAVLRIEVREESVQDVARVDRLQAEAESGGWTVSTVRALLERLSVEAPVQAAAIRLAAENDGFVSREAVYELGGYGENRTLRGFTKPPNRIAQEFRAQGVIPRTAVDVIEAVYDSKVSYVQASGFRIPQELVPLMSE